LARAQDLRQGSPFDVLHRAPEEAVGGARAVPRYDVRVIEGRHEGCGPMERLLHLGPSPRRAPHHFQRDRLVELQVPCEVHEGRGPAPVYGLELEQAAQVVARRRFARITARGGLLDGGHGRGMTVNGSLVVPVTPPAFATNV